MDNDPKKTSKSITRFMLLTNINHFPTRPGPPGRMSIGMAWDGLNFYLDQMQN